MNGGAKIALIVMALSSVVLSSCLFGDDEEEPIIYQEYPTGSLPMADDEYELIPLLDSAYVGHPFCSTMQGVSVRCVKD